MAFKPKSLAAFAAFCASLAFPVSTLAQLVEGSTGSVLEAKAVAQFNEPWAMTFLPDGSMLVTEKSGSIFLVTQDGNKREIAGGPQVSYGGQGGLGDIIIHPGFASNNFVYVSFAQAGEGNVRGAAVMRGRLVLEPQPRLEDMTLVWQQLPKTTGGGHYGHRLAFAPDGKLFITSGDRQLLTPAQDMTGNLGKIIRLNDDGSVPSDNPFQNDGALAKTFWSIGHRNPLGIAFDAQGRLWSHEMGPRGGDELNIVKTGANHGWPIVSDGNNYDFSNIPDHETQPQFHAPEVTWTPVIAPAGMVIHSGKLITQWQGNAIIAGLRSGGLVRVELDSQPDGQASAQPGSKLAREVERIGLGSRIREVEEGPDGAVWVLEDREGGRLIRLAPASQ